MNRPAYSFDGKKIGFLRQVLLEYIVVKKGLMNLSSYLIPKSLAESIDKKGIRLRITAFEVRRKYSYSKMKRLALYGEVPKSAVRERIVYDRLQTALWHNPEQACRLHRVYLRHAVPAVRLQGKHRDLQPDKGPAGGAHCPGLLDICSNPR